MTINGIILIYGETWSGAKSNPWTGMLSRLVT